MSCNFHFGLDHLQMEFDFHGYQVNTIVFWNGSCNLRGCRAFWALSGYNGVGSKSNVGIGDCCKCWFTFKSRNRERKSFFLTLSFEPPAKWHCWFSKLCMSAWPTKTPPSLLLAVKVIKKNSRVMFFHNYLLLIKDHFGCRWTIIENHWI